MRKNEEECEQYSAVDAAGGRGEQGWREGNELDNAQMSTFSLPGVQTNRKTLNFSNWERSVLPDEQRG